MAYIQQLFAFDFMVHALAAGTIVAVLCGAIGWFMVLRKQSFAGHTLAVVGFPGASGATLLGIVPVFGFFAFCLAAAGVIGLARPAGGGESRQESAAIGAVQASALACGFLFVSLYRGNVEAVSALLFGSFLGVSAAEVWTLLGFAVASLLALGAISRPLLFASVDARVAEAGGVPVRGLSVLFLLLLGAAAAEASQITGSLLVFALLVAPAATAQRLTASPGLGVALSIALALAVTWLGLALAYYSPFPVGFYITGLAFAAYLLAQLPSFRPTSRPKMAAA